MPIDYSTIPTEDLKALKTKDYGKVSTKTLQYLKTDGTEQPTEAPKGRSWKETASDIYRPTLEGLGMVAGGMAGTPAGPVGNVAGGTLGYMGGSTVSDLLDQFTGVQKTRTPFEEMKEQAKKGKTGLEYSMGGEVLPSLIAPLMKGAGYAGKQTYGFLTGKGPENIAQAFRGGKEFLKGLRGMTTLKDVYDEVKGAIQGVKDMRAEKYRAQLSDLKGASPTGQTLPAVPGAPAPQGAMNQPLDVTPIVTKFENLMKSYNIKVSANPQTGTLNIDTSRIAMGKRGIKDIEDIIQKVGTWGQHEGDNTALGLDTLKRQLDDFYSDSSQARGFVSSLLNTVKDLIVRNVPGYAEMTKDYAKSSNLIKELEGAFTGKGGHAQVDTVLRKLTRVMQEDPDYRRGLLDTLTGITGKDLQSQIAGVSMQPMIPSGLVGRSLGAAELYALLLGHANPKLWLMFSMGSPRVVGEFMNVLGQGYREAAAVLPKSGYGALAPALEKQKEDVKQITYQKWKEITDESGK